MSCNISKIIARLEKANLSKDKRARSLLDEIAFERQFLPSLFKDFRPCSSMGGWLRYRHGTRNIWACVLPESQFRAAETFADRLLEGEAGIDKVLFFIYSHGDLLSTRIFVRKKGGKCSEPAGKEMERRLREQLSSALNNVEQDLLRESVTDAERKFCTEIEKLYREEADRKRLLLMRIIMNRVLEKWHPSDIDFVVPDQSGSFHLMEFKSKSPAHGMYVRKDGRKDANDLFDTAESAQNFLRARWAERILPSSRYHIGKVLEKRFGLEKLQVPAIGLDLVHVENVGLCGQVDSLVYDYIYFDRKLASEDRNRISTTSIDPEKLYYCRVRMPLFTGINFTTNKDSGKFYKGPRIQLMLEAKEFRRLQLEL